MGIELLFLIILSIAMILSVPKFNENLPIGLQNITEKKTYLMGIFICVLILSMFNIQYLVYFSVLFIMIKVCFVEKTDINIPDIKNTLDHIKNNAINIMNKEVKEQFNNGSNNKKIYYDDEVCVKLSHSNDKIQEIVNQYNNDFGPK